MKLLRSMLVLSLLTAPVGCSSVVTPGRVPLDAAVDVIAPAVDAVAAPDASPAGTGCADAAELRPGVETLGSTAGTDDFLRSCPGRDGTGGSVRWYRLTIAAGEAMDVTATPETQGTAYVRVFAECPDAPIVPCVAAATATDERHPTTLRLNNPSTAAHTYLLAVGAEENIPATSDFAFRLIANPVVAMPADNSMCSSARLVAAAETLHDDTNDLWTWSPECHVTATGSGSPRWYRVTVPAGQTVRATAVADGAGSPAVRVYDRCDTLTCLAGPLQYDSGAEVFAAWTNRGATPRDVLITVAGDSFGHYVSYSLSVRIERP